MDSLVFQTPLGYTAFARKVNTLLALTFGHSSERTAVSALRARAGESFLTDRLVNLEEDDLAQRVYAFSAGKPVSFDDILVDVTGRTPFQCRVLQACRAIPRGETRTYGQLAIEAGKPGAARAVGSVMASNRTPLVIPCHRVVLASGGRGKFSAPRGETMRRHLLALEQANQPCLTE